MLLFKRFSPWKSCILSESTMHQIKGCSKWSRAYLVSENDSLYAMMPVINIMPCRLYASAGSKFWKGLKTFANKRGSVWCDMYPKCKIVNWIFWIKVNFWFKQHLKCELAECSIHSLFIQVLINSHISTMNLQFVWNTYFVLFYIIYITNAVKKRAKLWRKKEKLFFDKFLI